VGVPSKCRRVRSAEPDLIGHDGASLSASLARTANTEAPHVAPATAASAAVPQRSDPRSRTDQIRCVVKEGGGRLRRVERRADQELLD
jgi:hypothetical protein